MKKTDIDIEKLSTEELKMKLQEAQTSYTKIKIAHKVTPIENPVQIRYLRRSIAAIHTELRNKQ